MGERNVSAQLRPNLVTNRRGNPTIEIGRVSGPVPINESNGQVIEFYSDIHRIPVVEKAPNLGIPELVVPVPLRAWRRRVPRRSGKAHRLSALPTASTRRSGVTCERGSTTMTFPCSS